MHTAVKFGLGKVQNNKPLMSNTYHQSNGISNRLLT